MNTCFRPSPLHFLRRVLVGLLIAVAVATLFGFIVEHLWNALMPGLFHLPLLTWLQAIGHGPLGTTPGGAPPPGHGHHRGGGPWKRGPFGGWHDRHQFRDWFEGEGREAFQAWKAKEGQA
jgi:uncharacterized membrane protein YraQ (UPF0718 family)